MGKLDDDFGEIDTARIDLGEIENKLPKATLNSTRQRIGDLSIIDFKPNKTYDPEDSKWDQLVTLPSGVIIELRSSNKSVPVLKLGVKVVYGSERSHKDARIAGFESRTKEESPSIDTPIVILNDGTRIYDLRSILKVEDPLPENLQIPGQINWLQANFSVDIPDEMLITYYRDEFQEQSPNEAFFIAIKDKMMLVRVLNDKSLLDAEVKVVIEKNGQVILKVTAKLNNGFYYLTLPSQIEVTDIIKVKLFKKTRL